MSIRFDSVGEYLTRTTGLVDCNAAYTVAFWVYLSADRNDDSHFWAGGTNVPAAWQNSDWVSTGADGTTLSLGVAAAGVNTSNLGTALSVGVWYHVALVRSSATLITCYLNGVSDITNTRDVSARSATDSEVLGTHNGSIFRLDGRVFALKEWSAALTAAEIKNEMQTVVPRRALNQVAWYPMLPGSGERTRNYKSGGANWTENGTLTDELPPPVSWGGGAMWAPFAASGTFTMSPSGGIVFSGADPFVRGRVFPPAGGVVFNGSMPITFTPVGGAPEIPARGRRGHGL